VLLRPLCIGSGGDRLYNIAWRVHTRGLGWVPHRYQSHTPKATCAAGSALISTSQGNDHVFIDLCCWARLWALIEAPIMQTGLDRLEARVRGQVWVPLRMDANPMFPCPHHAFIAPLAFY